MVSPQPVELVLPGAATSVPLARQFVLDTLRAWRLSLDEHAAAAVVSELATNAVLHARSRFTVRLSLEAGALRLEVADSSAAHPVRRTPSQEATTGRGMSIVHDLVSGWGVEPLPDGKSVWVRWDGVGAP